MTGDRWVQEVQHLCADLGVKNYLDNDALLIEKAPTVLRLTSFQNYYFIAIGIKTNQTQEKWVGFATVPRDELPEFLRNTL